MGFRRQIKKVNVPIEPEKAYGKALQTAYNILAFKDNTEGELRGKLLERGYSEDTVLEVIETVKAKGFLDEERMVYRMIYSLSENKLLGRARILQEIRQKGFSRKTLEAIDFRRGELSEIDFSDICFRLLKKKDFSKDRKTYAFLVRHGHSSQDIRAAYKRAEQEQPDRISYIDQDTEFYD